MNARFRTPHVAIVLTGLFMVMCLFLALTILVKVASSVLILTFLFSCLSVIVYLRSRGTAILELSVMNLKQHEDIPE